MSSEELAPLEKNIQLVIRTIENVVGKETINISFIVEHKDIILGESNFLKIEPDFSEPPPVYDIDFVVNVSLNLYDRSTVDSLVSTPILIKAKSTPEKETELKSPVSDIETKKRTKFTMNSPTPVTIIGICSVDVMPIILGEKSFVEKVILETPRFSFDNNAVSWKNRPLLTIAISQDEECLFRDQTVNIISFTVESLYNLPRTFTEDLNYTAGTVVYVDNETPEKIFFEGGAWTKYRDVERTKRWNTLYQLDSRAKLSKYKLDCDLLSLKNEFKSDFDLAKKVCEDAPRIEWNFMSRSIIRSEGIEAMHEHIRKLKYWPFEVLITQRTPQIAKTKSKDQKKSQTKSQLYQCFMDSTELLFPGRTSTRCVLQLHTYNAVEAAEKVGLQETIFVLENEGKESREKEKKTRGSKHTHSTQSDVEVAQSTPVFSETGEPTLIVIEIELYQPLVPCRILADFSELMDELMPIAEKKTPYAYSGDLAEEQYAHCIKKLSEIITESYRDFRCEAKEKKCTSKATEKGKGELGKNKRFKYYNDHESDELTRFTQYLYRTGVYLSVRTALRAKVTMLLDQKFKLSTNIVNSRETQNFIASVYTYLVERMHMAINKVVEGRSASDSPRISSTDKLYLYAEEAKELGLLDDAKYYYTTAIASNRSNPDPWTKYAIFLMNVGEMDRAKECIREAIALDRRHKIALLTYASILFKEHRYREAEIFLRAVVDFYPRFAEGWTVLNLFYIRTEYYPGVDLAFRIAEKCMKDKDRDEHAEHEPLAWSTSYCPQRNVYAITNIFLLKLRLLEFAEMSLVQEMSITDRSFYVLYYMAVGHYLSGRYEDALSYLKEIECSQGMDYPIGSLMGHCYFQMNEFSLAMDCYEFTRSFFDRPDNLHLVEVRMGLRYIEIGDYEQAKKVFLSACKSSPTSQTWFGAGISLYHLNKFEEAEAALSEANRIDNRNPEIWGYLCLLNMSLKRYDEFAQCYREVIKNSLKNTKLWLIITKSMEALGYEPPTLTSASLNEDQESEESEEQFGKCDGIV